MGSGKALCSFSSNLDDLGRSWTVLVILAAVILAAVILAMVILAVAILAILT